MSKQTSTKLLNTLKKAGPVIKAKNGNGLIIYNPTNPDIEKIENYCESLGLKCIYKSEETMFEGRSVPPRIWIGKNE